MILFSEESHSQGSFCSFLSMAYSHGMPSKTVQAVEKLALLTRVRIKLFSLLKLKGDGYLG